PEERTVSLDVNLVPAHVRNLQRGIAREPPDFSGDDVQSLVNAELLAFSEEELQTQTDAQKRLPRIKRGSNRFDQAESFQVRHAITKGPNPRQHNMTGIPDDDWVSSDNRLMPARLKRLPDAAQISHSVVVNRDHGRFLRKVVTIPQLPSLRHWRATIRSRLWLRPCPHKQERQGSNRKPALPTLA